MKCTHPNPHPMSIQLEDSHPGVNRRPLPRHQLLGRRMSLPIVIFALLMHLHETHSADVDDLDWNRANAVVYYGPNYVKEGDTLEISCQMSRFQAPKWTHNEQEIEKNIERIKESQGEGHQTSRMEKITIRNIRLQDSGYYRCNSFTRNAHLVNVIPVNKQHSLIGTTGRPSPLFQVLEEENSTIEINCKLSVVNPKAPVYWSKNGNYIVPDSRRYHKGTNLLIVNATSDRDTGVYLCRTDNMQAEGGNTFGRVIELRAPIRVKPFSERVMHKVQGESVRLSCNYSGFPRGNITWIIGNNRFNEHQLNASGIRLENGQQPGDVLHIESLQMDHSNTYTCLVNNSITANEGSVIVKVRGMSARVNVDVLHLNVQQPASEMSH